MEVLMEKAISYLQYPFVTYALIVGVLISLASSLFGVILVLKRLSYMGDGLSHVAFGAMCIASVLNLSGSMPFMLVVTMLSAILLLRKGESASLRADASIAMMSVGALAIGYFLMNVFSTRPNISGDVCTTLFGSTSILTLTEKDVWLTVILAVVSIALFVILYHKIFMLTFDEDFARAAGMNTKLYNLLVAIIVAVIIVLAMNLVGSLLIAALIVFPALTAMKLFRSFRSVTMASAVIAVICTFLGMTCSILASTPVGATIVIFHTIFYGLAAGVEAIRR